jgi:hypothetical protein
MTRGLITLLTLASLIAIAAIVLLWKRGDRAQSLVDGEAAFHPAETSPASRTAYRNWDPKVEYVGDQACAACHKVKAISFHQHPMGRSAAYVPGASSDVERYDRSAQNPFEALGLEFQVEPSNRQVVHKEVRRDAQHQVVTELAAEVLLAIGSGTHGRSFVVNRDGYLCQSPISWFTETQSWGLSPGFGEPSLHFQRPISVQCLFCHVNQATLIEHTGNRYVQPLPQQLTIGCERCHGPGQLHVRRRQAREQVEGVDDTIINPADLEPALREAVCQQCHLLGEQRIIRRGRNPFDYRPGLPLDLIFSTFVQAAGRVDSRKTVSHVEQMARSRCFRATNAARSGDGGAAASADPRRSQGALGAGLPTPPMGALGCISCHDPHERPAPAERVAYFRERCLACHKLLDDGRVETAGTGQDHSAASPLSIRHSSGDDCIDCHMPRRSAANVAHAAITDHRIVRWRDRPPQPTANDQPPGPPQLPLVDFSRDRHHPNDLEQLRDLGLALINMAGAQGDEDLRRLICRRAQPLLEQAIQNHPEDIEAQEDRAYAMWAQGDRREALAIYEELLAKIPERQASRLSAARIAMELGEDETAIAHLRRLLAANSWSPRSHYLLAQLLGKHRDCPGAVAEGRAALRLDPTQVPVRQLLITGYLQTGDRKRAGEEFALLERLQPAEIDKLRTWYQEQTRRER